jgi:uncharacterized protein (TIGR02118 family)
MYRVTVLYENEPDPQEYAAHAEMCRCVPGSAFRHGKVMGSPMGDAPHAYYAEWEFPSKEAFDAAVRSEEFMATGKDAYKRGFSQPMVQFVELAD